MSSTSKTSYTQHPQRLRLSARDSKTDDYSPKQPDHMKTRSEVNADKTVRNSLIAGSLSGITAAIAFHPLDVIRTKIQSMSVASTSSGSLKSSSSAMTASRPPSAFSVLTDTIQHGGYRSLYTGLSMPLAFQAVYKATVFTVNKVSRNALLEWKTQERRKTGNFSSYKLGPSDTFICGSISGAFNAAMFVAPVEYVRNQLIAQDSRLAAEEHHSKGTTPKQNIMRGPADVIRTTIRNSGILGLWRGTGVTIIRDSLGCGLFFLTFEVTKSNLSKLNNGEGNFFISLLAGATAGIGYWGAAMPFDTAKTLVQTGSSDNASSAFSKYIAQDGMLGALRMYRGWQVAFVRAAPAAAVTILTYDFCFDTLRKYDL